MRRNYFPTASDMHAAVKMINDLYGSPADPILRRRLLIQRLCQILHLAAGASFVIDGDSGIKSPPLTWTDKSMSRLKQVSLPPEEQIRYACQMAEMKRSAFSVCHPTAAQRKARRPHSLNNHYSPFVLSAISLDQ